MGLYFEHPALHWKHTSLEKALLITGACSQAGPNYDIRLLIKIAEFNIIESKYCVSSTSRLLL